MKNQSKLNFVSLGSLTTVPPQNGYSPICNNEPTGKWLLGLSALTENGLDLSQVKPASADDPLIDRFIINEGDFLISRSNTLDKVGRIGLYRGELGNCSYPDLMMRFRVSTSKVCPDYLEIYLRSDKVVKYIQQNATGTSGSMKKINQKTVESIPVLLPPLDIQQKIAVILGSWNIAIEKTAQLILAKELFLKALYHHFFTPTHLLHTGWKKVRINHLLIPRDQKSVPSHDLPLYSLTIEDGVTPKTDRYNREFLVRDTNSKTYKVVHPSDIVFNPPNLRWGAIARSEVNQKVLVSPIYEVLAIDKGKVNPDLLAHALTCARQISIFALMVEGTLIERMAVKLNTFLTTEIILPIERNQQDKIAELLNAAKEEIKLLKTNVNAYQKQKRGLMQKLLTGKWRVRPDEPEVTE